MSAWINCISKHNGNITPVVRADVKWRCARLELTFAGDKWEVGGMGYIAGVGRFARRARSWEITAFPPVMLFFPMKSEK